jgi:succinate dehydrogenase/fumarate reductase flavoprotein subunit
MIGHFPSVCSEQPYHIFGGTMVNQAERYLEADILIVGGGSAGCMAAHRALELNPDLKVVIFEKGDIKYSGSIARGMDALNVVAIPNISTPDEYLEAASRGANGIFDEPASYEMADRSFEMLKKLEDWGVYFPLDKNGEYLTLQLHYVGKFLAAMEEPDLKVIISRRAIDKGAEVVNRVMGLQLLMEDGRTAGCVGLDVRSGELTVCRAKAVIMSAGGAGRFSLPNSGHLYGTFDFPGNTGDGYAMAYRAGAELTGLEHCWRSVVIKDVNIPLLGITMPRGGRMVDIYDDVILEREFHNSLTIMEQAINEGRDPVRVKLAHLPVETIQEIEHILFSTERPVQQRFFSGRNIDFRKDDIELWPTDSQLCGGHGLAGIRINQRTETNIPGFFAAGDAASVPKQHLTGAFVFGEIAAEEAVAFATRNSDVRLDEKQVDAMVGERNHRHSAGGRDIDVRELEFKVRRFINDYVISPKNAYKLNRWLAWRKRFDSEIKDQVIVRNGHELSKLYEVENIILCASLSARAALERKESRWGQAHRRTDYPETDNENWHCHLIVRKSEAEKIQVMKKPLVKLPKREVVA